MSVIDEIKLKFGSFNKFTSIHDKLWVRGDDSHEYIVPHPYVFRDKVEAKIFSKFIGEINALGCMSFQIGSEEINSMLKQFGKKEGEVWQT